MPNALLWDVETSGLAMFGAANPADADWQPRMVSIAAAVVDDNGDVLARLESLIKPVGWPLDNEAFRKNMEGAEKFHGLTLERLEADGRPIEEVYEDWAKLYAEAEIMAAFNIMFDHKVMRGAWRRIGHEVPFRDKPWFCLMRAATPICKLPPKRASPDFKYPKLSEAVEIILGRPHEKAHTAAGDLDSTIDLYRWFQAEKKVETFEQPEARNKPEAPAPVEAGRAE